MRTKRTSAERAAPSRRAVRRASPTLAQGSAAFPGGRDGRRQAPAALAEHRAPEEPEARRAELRRHLEHAEAVDDAALEVDRRAVGLVARRTADLAHAV